MAEKKYVIDNPTLMAEWNWEKNTSIDPSQFALGSNKKVWWKCEKGHEWQAIIANRNHGHKCPYCSGKKVLKGYNDLQTLNPTLAIEWNYDKNSGLLPVDVTPGSNKIVWWICNKGHEWQASINRRNNDSGCPYCSGRKALKGYNDLQTINPDVAKEWNYEKNNGLLPTDVTPGSNKKVWWICNKGHEWQVSVVSRLKSNCPYCAGSRVIEGENDFQTIHPELMSEWNYEKNIGINPSQIMSSVALKVWWKCEKGHEWKASPNNRSRGSGCPVCASEIQTSYPEKAIYYYLSQILNVESRFKLSGYEIDIYIDSLKLGIEYDGIFYHSKEKKIILDEKKSQKIKSLGIRLIRIKESDNYYFDMKNNTFYYVPNSQYTNLNPVIEKLIEFINIEYNLSYEINVNIKQDNIDILNTYKMLEKKNSFGAKFPLLAKEWNYEKNGCLKPEQFSPKSNFKVWWKCEKGHEWESSINRRSSRGAGCPICSGHKVLKGFNDLATKFPELANEWNYEKNIDLHPDEVVAFSDKKVWWKCTSNHEWEAIISSRSRGGSGCPYCSGNKVTIGVNDFATWCKQNNKEFLLTEFDTEKNDFSVVDIFPGGDIEVWWTCPTGHSYSTQIKNRTLRNTNCPYCARKKVLVGFNDLATTHPHIAEEWDYEKNNGVLPTQVVAGSIVNKYWFICPQGHSYSSNLLNRKKGKGCPICSGRVASENNNLLSACPNLCKDWDYAKNQITPDKVTNKSGKIVWWKCHRCGAEWQAKIITRVEGFRKCPKCVPKRKHS